MCRTASSNDSCKRGPEYKALPATKPRNDATATGKTSHRYRSQIEHPETQRPGCYTGSSTGVLRKVPVDDCLPPSIYRAFMWVRLYTFQARQNGKVDTGSGLFAGEPVDTARAELA